MSFNISGGTLDTTRTKLTDNTATAVYTATSPTRILSIVCGENNGDTPNLTIDIYDGTNAYYLRKAVAMSAGEAFIFNEPFALPAGWSVRVTSSGSSGHIDVHVSYITPVALAR